jgi:hypothetical protein
MAPPRSKKTSVADATTTTTTADLLAALASCPSSRLAGRRLTAPGGERQIASLWAGYGKVTELSVVVAGDDDDGSHRHDLVVKRVSPPPGRPDDVGHARKVDSYAFEASFYREVAPRLLALPPGDVPRVGAPFLVVEDGTTTTLVLEDLRPAFPVFPRGGLSRAQLGAALRWLAAFHAAFWGCGTTGGNGGLPPPAITPPPSLAAREGTYWHLATRPDELAAIVGDAEHGDLAAAAPGIAADLLAGAAGPHGTLVHGDAKAANFCFTTDGGTAAAFDFQYVGSGLGARDVAYLLCSAGGSREIGTPGSEDAWLELYFSALAPRLAARGFAVEGHGGDAGGAGPPYTRAVLKSHYELAAADFYRFMAGWGTWGAADVFGEVARRVVAEREKGSGGGGGRMK